MFLFKLFVFLLIVLRATGGDFYVFMVRFFLHGHGIVQRDLVFIGFVSWRRTITGVVFKASPADWYLGFLLHRKSAAFDGFHFFFFLIQI